MRSSASQHQAAQDELELYFAAAPGLWGLRGAPFDGGGGVAVWDERRSNVEHAARCREVGRVYDSEAHQWHGIESQHDRLRAVTATCEKFRREIFGAWSVAMMVLTPRRWPTKLAEQMARYTYFGSKCRGNLTGLLLRSAKLRALAGEDATPMRLLELAEERASASNRDEASRNRFFDALRDETERVFTVSLRAYDGLRVKRLRSAVEITEYRRALG